MIISIRLRRDIIIIVQVQSSLNYMYVVFFFIVNTITKWQPVWGHVRVHTSNWPTSNKPIAGQIFRYQTKYMPRAVVQMVTILNCLYARQFNIGQSNMNDKSHDMTSHMTWHQTVCC